MVAILTGQSVNILNDMLDLTESMEELLAGLEHVLAEDVLLAVHVEEREAFLSRIKDFSEVA